MTNRNLIYIILGICLAFGIGFLLAWLVLRTGESGLAAVELTAVAEVAEVEEALVPTETAASELTEDSADALERGDVEADEPLADGQEETETGVVEEEAAPQNDETTSGGDDGEVAAGEEDNGAPSEDGETGGEDAGAEDGDTAADETDAADQGEAGRNSACAQPLKEINQQGIKEKLEKGERNFSCHKITGEIKDQSIVDAMFTNADFTGATLINVNLTNSKLTGATLGQDTFKSVILKGVDLVGAVGLTNNHLEAAHKDMSGIMLNGHTFKKIKLDEVNFSDATLVGTTFFSSSLNNANFTRAVLYGANFKDTKLKHANFTGSAVGCDLRVSENPKVEDFTVAVLAVEEAAKTAADAKMAVSESMNDPQKELETKASAKKAIEGANTARLKLAEALLISSKIAPALGDDLGTKLQQTFNEVDMAQKHAIEAAENAKIGRPHFSLLDTFNEYDYELNCEHYLADQEAMPSKRTTFGWADLTGAAFYKADLRYADFTHAVMRNTKFNNPGYAVTARTNRPEDPSTAYLQGAILDWADLTGACFSGANLSEAYLRNSLLKHVELEQTNLKGADLTQAFVSPHAIETAFCSPQTTLPFNFDAISAYVCETNGSK